MQHLYLKENVKIYLNNVKHFRFVWTNKPKKIRIEAKSIFTIYLLINLISNPIE